MSSGVKLEKSSTFLPGEARQQFIGNVWNQEPKINYRALKVYARAQKSGTLPTSYRKKHVTNVIVQYERTFVMYVKVRKICASTAGNRFTKFKFKISVNCATLHVS